jgi:pimeloyl-ACP methyl ester carboxylesterase
MTQPREFDSVRDISALVFVNYGNSGNPILIYQPLDKNGQPLVRNGKKVFAVILTGTEGDSLKNLLQGSDGKTINDTLSAVITGQDGVSDYEKLINKTLRNFLSSQGLSPNQVAFDLFGHSQGGMVAQLIAIRAASPNDPRWIGQIDWSGFQIDNVITFAAAPPIIPVTLASRPHETQFWSYYDKQDIIQVATPEGVREITKYLLPATLSKYVNQLPLENPQLTKDLFNTARNVNKSLNILDDSSASKLEQIGAARDLINSFDGFTEKYLGAGQTDNIIKDLVGGDKAQVDKLLQRLRDLQDNNTSVEDYWDGYQLNEEKKSFDQSGVLSRLKESLAPTLDKIDKIEKGDEGELQRIVDAGTRGTNRYLGGNPSLVCSQYAIPSDAIINQPPNFHRTPIHVFPGIDQEQPVDVHGGYDRPFSDNPLNDNPVPPGLGYSGLNLEGQYGMNQPTKPLMYSPVSKSPTPSTMPVPGVTPSPK